MVITQKQNQKDWLELCSYVKKEILKYDDEKLFPKKMALRLKGLACGKEYPVSGFTQIYSYAIILKVFRVLKPCIEEVLEKVKIKNEDHYINLIMKIVWDNFNDMMDAYRKKTRRENEMKKRNMTDILVQDNNNQDNYVNKDRKVKDNW